MKNSLLAAGFEPASAHLNDRISDTDHVLGQVLDEGQETSFGVKPG